MVILDPSGPGRGRGSELCKFAKSNDDEDAFVSFSQGKHELYFGGSGEREGLDYEIGEITHVGCR